MTRLDRHRRVLGPSTPLFYDDALHLVRGDGVWLFDGEGRRYLDVYNNVPCVGHANPVVADAIAAQVRTLNVHSRYLHDGVLDYAERLAALHHDRLSTAVFACTGTEANEIAVMMARTATGGSGIITTDAAYHGNSTEISKLNEIARRRDSGLTGDPSVRAVPVPDADQLESSGFGPDAGCDLLVEAIEAQIDGFSTDGVGFAGVLMCSLLANEGLPRIPERYFHRVTELVHSRGGVIIADEVQAGFGRSGRWWGYEHSADFAPDIVTMGKPMGGGVPVAGVMAEHELVAGFRQATRYFNTFAASPLQAAAGSAVLDVIEGEGLVESVAEVGDYLAEQLRSVDGPPSMGAVRGIGLFLGIDWLDAEGEPDPEGAHCVVEAMKSNGVLMGRAGAHDNVLKIRPPLVFEREHADVFLDAFATVLAAIDG